MNYGISQNSMKLIIRTLDQRKEVKKAVIFGSRSVGNYKNGSDIDIAIYGEDITWETANQLSIELNEKSPLPYYFDILPHELLKHKELKEHINTYGKIFYKRD